MDILFMVFWSLASIIVSVLIFKFCFDNDWTRPPYLLILCGSLLCWPVLLLILLFCVLVPNLNQKLEDFIDNFEITINKKD